MINNSMWKKITDHPMPKGGHFIVGRPAGHNEPFYWAEVEWVEQPSGTSRLFRKGKPLPFVPTHWFKPGQPVAQQDPTPGWIASAPESLPPVVISPNAPDVIDHSADVWVALSDGRVEVGCYRHPNDGLAPGWIIREDTGYELLPSGGQLKVVAWRPYNPPAHPYEMFAES